MRAAHQRILRFAASALMACAAGQAITAEDYPSKPIRLVVPYGPGGAVDTAGRLLAQQLGGFLKQQVVVEHRAGGASVVGTTAVVNAPADGYSLLLGSLAIVTNQSLIKNIPYDPARDLKAIAMLSSSPLLLIVNAKVPATDIKSLIAHAKAHPGQLNASTAGIGTAPHLAAELFSASSGIEITPIAYKGSGPGMVDLVSGRVQMSFISIAAAKPHVDKGAVRGLATTGLKRSVALPNLPTVAETIPGFEVDLWIALFAPARTPEPVIQQLNGAVRRALASDQLREGFLRVGQEPTGSNPAEAQKFIDAEMLKWTKVIRDARITAE